MGSGFHRVHHSQMGPEEAGTSRSSGLATHVQRVLLLQQHAGNRAVRDVLAPRAPTPAKPTLQRACQCGGICPACQRDEPADGTPSQAAVQRSAEGTSLDPGNRSRLESAFGTDLGHVRVRADETSTRSARALDAIAFSTDDDVFVDSSAAPRGSVAETFVLAHEIAHLLQPRAPEPSMGPPAADDGAEMEAYDAAERAVLVGKSRPMSAARRGSLHRFEASERARITNLEAVLATARSIADQAVVVAGKAGPREDWGKFVEGAGGMSASDKASMVARGSKTLSRDLVSLPNRYLYTCACGLVDLRHFYQLMYIAIMRSNAKATEMGREHELSSEATSRFAPEDTPSNAMGAFFASEVENAGITGGPAFAEKLKGFLEMCRPVDFAALPAADQDAIVDYYGTRTAAGVPMHQNETATASTPSVSVCTPANSASPFVVDPKDPKTIIGKSGSYALTGDTEIRNWVSSQAEAVRSEMPAFEKIRLVNRLLDGWVSEGDLAAVEQLCAAVHNPADSKAIRDAITPRTGELVSSKQRDRLKGALSRMP